jgi:hypothetical protein
MFGESPASAPSATMNNITAVDRRRLRSKYGETVIDPH